MLIPDGAYTFESRKPRFHRTTAPTHAELDALLNRIINRLTRQLERDGLLIQDTEQAHLDLNPTDLLDQFGAASVQYRVILGPNACRKTLTLRQPVTTPPASTPKPFTASRDGFSL